MGLEERKRLFARIQTGHRCDFFLGSLVAFAGRVLHGEKHPIALFFCRPAEVKGVSFVPADLVNHRAHQYGIQIPRRVFRRLPAARKQVFRLPSAKRAWSA